ncbi:MAG: GntR family transcriptional regulator [Collinsella sp.]
MEQHQHYQSLQDQAYNALRSKIIYAELKPGTRLSAIGLEKETGIGRTPIRESFVRLREQELVETRPKSGTYVSKISMERAENACFLREKLERSVLLNAVRPLRPSKSIGSSRFLPSPSRSTIAKRVAFSIWTTCSMRRVLRLRSSHAVGLDEERQHAF